MFDLFDFLIANVDVFTIKHYRVTVIVEQLKHKLYVFFEQFEPTEKDVEHIANFYTVFLQTTIFTKYPPYLELQIIKNNSLPYFNESTTETINKEYDEVPLFLLKFTHYDKTNYPFLMFLANRGKYDSVKFFYEKYPELARIMYYDIGLKTVTNFTRCIFSRYSNKAIYPHGAPYNEERDGIMRTIIENEKKHLDHPTVRAQLADPKYHVNAILTIFEPYIKHYKIYEEFPELRESMIEYELLE